MDIKSLIREVPDFPKPGVLFRDITPVLACPEAFSAAVDHFVERYRRRPVDALVAVDARGFILAAPIAYLLAVPLLPVRKEGKLPPGTRSVAYDLEYGQSVIEMNVDALASGQRVAIIDDLLATGGTLAAAAELVESAGGEVAEMGILVELEDLGGRRRLSGWPVHSMVTF